MKVWFFSHSVCVCTVFCCKNMYIHHTEFLKLFSPCQGFSMHILSISCKSLASRPIFISSSDCVVREWRFCFGFCFLTIQSVRVKFCVIKMKIFIHYTILGILHYVIFSAIHCTIFGIKVLSLCECLYMSILLIAYKSLAPRPWLIFPQDCVVWEWIFCFELFSLSVGEGFCYKIICILLYLFQNYSICAKDFIYMYHWSPINRWRLARDLFVLETVSF